MSSLLTTVLTRRSKERAALDQLIQIIQDIYEKRKAEGVKKGDFLESLHDGY